MYRYFFVGKSALAWELIFSGSLVFHIKVGASPFKCLAQGTQQANLPACSPQSPINAERQAGKL